jgi:sugar-specific transcriptional regulator TrmB
MMQIKNYSLVEKLEKSGFTDKEAKIYVTLLELDGAYPSKIAEYTDLNRSTVYHILLNLSVRGIIGEVEKRNKMFYQIERPSKVVSYGQSRIRRAEDELEQIKSVLPDIEGLFGALGTRPKVTYYENTDGMVSVYEDMIATDKKYELLAWSNAAELEHVIPAKFFERFRRAKEKIGITTRGISPDTAGDRTYSERLFKGFKPGIAPTIRYVSAEKFPFKGEIVIYEQDKLAIINLNKEFLTATIIQDATIHDMMRLIFEMSWNSSMVRE